MLGISALYPKATTKSFHGSRRDNFIMDEVKCIGTEETLEDCPHETKDDCGGTEGAGVICSSNKKYFGIWHVHLTMYVSDKFPIELQGGPDNRSGNVMFLDKPIWYVFFCI